MFVKKEKLLLLSILTGCTIVYLNSFNCSFHFDDRYVIVDNALIKDIKNLPVILTNIFSRPLLKASFAINYYFSGLDVRGYHLFNLILHLIVVCELYIFVRLLSNNSMIALISAALFAYHPVHTGAVTYIASRSSVMVTSFYLASFIFFLKGRKMSRPIYFFLSILFFILGFGVKETIVTLPLMIAVYLWSFHKGRVRDLLKKFAWQILSFIIVITVYLLYRVATLSSIIPVDRRIYEGLLPWKHYLLTELTVVALYYPKWLFWPFDGIYIDPDIPVKTTLFDPAVIASIALLSGLVFLSFKLKRKNPVLSFSLLWYPIVLLPTSSVFPLGDLAVERRLYLSSIGIVIVCACFFGWIYKQLSPKIALIALFITVVVSGYLTIERNRVWKDEITLWTDAAKKSPNKVRVLNNRAFAFYSAGRLEEAEKMYIELLRRFPDYPYGYNNLGTIYEKKGQLDKALAAYKKAVSLRPHNPILRTKLALLYEKLGLLDKAGQELKTAYNISPENTQIITLYASNLAKQHRCNDAIKLARRAIDLSRKNHLAYYIMGYCYSLSGDKEKARLYLKRAISVKPGWAPALKMLENLEN